MCIIEVIERKETFPPTKGNKMGTFETTLVIITIAAMGIAGLSVIGFIGYFAHKTFSE